MATLTSNTTLTIIDALGVTETQDFIVQPENTGSLACRELSYPGDVLAPLVYEQNPDKWTNFDSSPMVKRPSISRTQTIEDNRLTGWFGYARDRPITETWKGSDTESSLMLPFFRQLYAYFENPPLSGFVIWKPKDRTTTEYNILINSLTAGASPDVTYDFLAARQNCILGDVVFTFTIVSEV